MNDADKAATARFLLGVIAGMLLMTWAIRLGHAINGLTAYDRGVRDHATGKAAYTEVTLPNGKTEWFVTRSDD